MPKTRADLVDEVADLLNLTGPGETLASEDRTKIERRIDPKIEDLAARRIVYIADADNIDDAYFEPLAALVAEVAGPSFGVPRNLEARLVAEDRFREMGGDGWTDGDVVKAQYF